MSSDQPSNSSRHQSAPAKLTGVVLTDKELGRGSDAVVQEAYYQGTVCAAKQLHEILLKDQLPGGAQRFRDNFDEEISKWCELKHPHIVLLLGVYYEVKSPVPILILEKMQTSLRRYIETHKKEAVPIPDKIFILRQVSQALAYLHGRQQPLVHHDLSPNNILLNQGSLLTKITDFGMSRIVDSSHSTRKSSMKGTLAFMSPEALSIPLKYTEKLDIFSFGNVVLFALTHVWPEPGPSVVYEGNKAVAVEEFERREQYTKSLTTKEQSSFFPMIQSCLQNRPDRRPTSFQLVQQMRQMEGAHPRLDCSNTIAQLIEQLKKKDGQLEEKDDHLKVKDLHIQKLTKRVEELSEEVEAQKQHEIDLKRDMDMLFAEKTAELESTVRLQDETAQLKQTVSILNEELDTTKLKLESRIKLDSEAMRELRSANHENKRMSQTLTEFQDKIAQLEWTVSTLEEELDTANLTILAKAKREFNLNQELKSVQQTGHALAELQEQNSLLQTQVVGFKETNAKLTQLMNNRGMHNQLDHHWHDNQPKGRQDNNDEETAMRIATLESERDHLIHDRKRQQAHHEQQYVLLSRELRDAREAEDALLQRVAGLEQELKASKATAVRAPPVSVVARSPFSPNKEITARQVPGIELHFVEKDGYRPPYVLQTHNARGDSGYSDGARKPAQNSPQPPVRSSKWNKQAGSSDSCSGSDDSFLPSPMTNWKVFQPNQQYIGNYINREILKEAKDYRKPAERGLPAPEGVDEAAWPYDPNLECKHCGKKFRQGQIREFRYHVDDQHAPSMMS